ncbi:RND family transporter [Mycobacterium sp. Aquia_213]|uniref:MMPL/RND family transporter n=1 Tax=Mycobacterium sp. Aquia_213 TaxID=2991728 RepID=UPI002272009B|nr:RND family transporter [Mycobacterium sp. Aquia_213]WAC92623.1 RND family transporter [Mycobacterium sp. Aquia_213]
MSDAVDAETDTAPVPVQEPEPPPPPRPFVARNLRRFAPVVILAWLAFLVVINVIVPQLEPVVDANREALVPVDAPSVMALKHIGEKFKEGDSNALVFVVFEADHKFDEKDHAFYNQMVAKLRQDKHVQYVMNLWGEGTTAAGVQSNDAKANFTLVRVAGDIGSTLNDESIIAVRDILKQLQPPPGLRVYASGSAVLSADMIYVGNTSLETIMLVTIVLISGMLLIVYRSLPTAFLILTMVLVELFCGRGIAAFLVYHHMIEISVYAANTLVSLILGAGTDYAIFLIGRYHEGRLGGETREQAYYCAISGVSHVILGSGVAVAGAMFCMKFTRLNYFNTCAAPCAAGMLVAVAAALTFGPAVLAIGSRFGLFEPRKHQAGHGIWNKVGTVAVRWPGRILLVGCAVVLVGSMTLVSYRPNYDDRIYLANSVPSNQGYEASDRHFPASHLNADMLMVESDHDLRNATDMIAVDRVARAIFHTPGVGMIQAVTRPLGRPLEHTSFTYTIGTLGTKVKEVLPFLRDVNNRLKEVSAVTQRLTDLTRHQQELTAQQAGAAHLQAEAAKEMAETTAALRDDYANFDDVWRPVRSYFYWEKHCFDIPLCWSLRSLFDATDQLDGLAEGLEKNLQAALIQDRVTPQLVQILAENADQFDHLNQIVREENSTIEPQLTQLDELSRQLMDFGTAFDTSQNDEFFYLPPDSFDNPYFQIDLKYFVSPDGHAARYLIYHDGEALTEAGIRHDQSYLPAVKEALKGTTLAGAHVYLGGAAATYWDIKDATRIDLLIAATAAFALIFVVMLFITRAIIASLVIVGTVAFSFSGAFGMSVLIWQNLLGIPLSWWNVVFCFILLVAVGSDYNLLLVARYLHESEAGLNTGLIRAVTKSGRVVTTAGVVFAVTMMAMVSSDLTSVGIFGSTVGIGLLLDTLIVRSLITPALARLLGPFFWWPRLIPQRPARCGSGAVAPESHHEDDLYRKVL